MSHTKRDKAASDLVKGAISAEQVNQLRRSGFDVPSGVEPAEFWNALVPLTGKHRPRWIAASVLAVERGWYTPALRQAVLEAPSKLEKHPEVLDIIDAQLRRSVLGTIIREQPQCEDGRVREPERVLIEEYTSNGWGLRRVYEPAEEAVEGRVALVKEDLASLMLGESVDGADITATSRRFSLMVTGEAEEGQDVYPDEFADAMAHAARALASKWVEEAEPSALVGAVQGIVAMWRATAVSKMGLSNEASWAFALTLAPCAAPLANALADALPSTDWGWVRGVKGRSANN